MGHVEWVPLRGAGVGSTSRGAVAGRVGARRGAPPSLPRWLSQGKNVNCEVCECEENGKSEEIGTWLTSAHERDEGCHLEWTDWTERKEQGLGSSQSARSLHLLHTEGRKQGTERTKRMNERSANEEIERSGQRLPLENLPSFHSLRSLTPHRAWAIHEVPDLFTCSAQRGGSKGQNEQSE